MTNKPTGWARVHHLATERRQTLGLSQKALAESAGISDTKLRQMRDGVAIARVENQRQLEAALGWEAGSIASILDGGDPDPIIDLDDHDLDEAMQDALREMRELAREMRELMPLVAEALGRPRS